MQVVRTRACRHDDKIRRAGDLERLLREMSRRVDDDEVDVVGLLQRIRDSGKACASIMFSVRLLALVLDQRTDVC